MSSPRVAIAAISSGPGLFFLSVLVLSVPGITLFFLPGGLPGGDQVVILAFGIMTDFEDN
jgi:hypothetical protein